MRAIVDAEVCIACGACIERCPEVFAMSPEGKSHATVDPIPAALEDDVRAAADGCPVGAIALY